MCDEHHVGLERDRSGPRPENWERLGGNDVYTRPTLREPPTPLSRAHRVHLRLREPTVAAVGITACVHGGRSTSRGTTSPASFPVHLHLKLGPAEGPLGPRNRLDPRSRRTPAPTPGPSSTFFVGPDVDRGGHHYRTATRAIVSSRPRQTANRPGRSEGAPPTSSLRSVKLNIGFYYPENMTH